MPRSPSEALHEPGEAKPDFYRVLGVSFDATEGAIRAAYLKLALVRLPARPRLAPPRSACDSSLRSHSVSAACAC